MSLAKLLWLKRALRGSKLFAKKVSSRTHGDLKGSLGFKMGTLKIVEAKMSSKKFLRLTGAS